MIVSHEHKFIFIKTRKTAGTSIEVALSAIAGEDAIVTPVTPPEPGHMPRNWQGWFNPFPELVDRYARREPSLDRWTVRATARNLKGRRRYYNHMPASVVRDRLGPEIWDEYFTFCFERDPWEKVVSWYFYVSRDNPDRLPFEQWALVRDLPSDWNKYTIGGTVAVDFVGRFTDLEADLHHALAQVGVRDAPALPRAKGQIRPTDSSNAITPAVDARIRSVFAEEIRHFGFVRPADGVS